MAVTSTQLLEGFAFEIKVDTFTIRTDVKEKLGGQNSAPDPHDYLEASLAACTAITVQMYAKRKGIPLDYANVNVKITAEGVQNEISREVTLMGALTDEQKTQLLAIADKCPIHKFLSKGAVIHTQLTS